ncbi:MAG TPA: FAD-binding oxidoreductase [Candidatus Limnocylindria bacterium]|nr:FAD-binding oxidoreductase [Candidatus Limnocylindria bacterium]
MKYGRITPQILEELKAIAGARNVTADEEKMRPYSHDETPEEQFGAMPEAVVTPTETAQVAAVMKLANRYLIPVTPRGAGSGLSGGAIPVHGGILLSLEKMNRVLEFDFANMAVVVEAGLITNEINAVAAPKGLFFAGYPMSLESCCVGGNIAENAGGGKAVKYGVTGQYVLGMELVTPEGDVVELGGRNVKDVTGYDLKRLIIGSEGTLGIVTKATIRLSPMPKHRCDLLVLYADVRTAIAAVPLIFSQAGITPTSIEFMDRLSARTACEYLGERLPYEQAGAMLLIETDGVDHAQVDADAEAIGELLMKNGALEVYVADNHTTQERVWAVRRSIAEAFKAVSPHQSLEDIVVPIGRIPDLIPTVESISARYGISMPTYGHAGDGNLHTTLVKDPAWTMERWYETEDRILEELYEAVKSLGGRISGEHGIGIKRKKHLARIMDPVELKLMRAVKRALDPNNIMNPGKMFDLEDA